jgi:nuclear pore complex protein Nup93
MMIYDRVITELNAARLRETSYPIVHSLMQASLSLPNDVGCFMLLWYLSIFEKLTYFIQPYSQQMTQNFHILAKIASEPPSLPPTAHATAHILNTPLLERRHARAYLSSPDSRDAVALRTQIARGAREALEEQYTDIIERTVQARPLEARLGGDPSVANRVRAFVLVRHYRNGEWEDRIEVYISFWICFRCAQANS